MHGHIILHDKDQGFYSQFVKCPVLSLGIVDEKFLMKPHYDIFSTFNELIC